MVQAMHRVCPFCGDRIQLNHCSIYATGEGAMTATEPRRASRAAAAGRRPPTVPGMSALAEFDEEGPSADEPRPASRSEPMSRRSAPLWTWQAPRQAEPSRRGSWFSSAPAARVEPGLVPLTIFPPERMARRFCTNPACDHPLPPDLDDRQGHILAIVGLNAAGKTHYLATALTEATNGDGLDVAGFQEFEPDDETAQYFYKHYYAHVYRDNRLFQQTPERARADQRPLAFRTRLDGGRPMLVMTHDIAGETLVNHVKRATDAGFLRRASAVIFLVDPLEFDDVRARVPQGDLPPVARTINQRDLLTATLRELEFAPGQRQVPVAVVISKSDMLAPFVPTCTELLNRPPDRSQTEEAWLREMQQSSNAARDVLLQLGQHRLVRAAETHGKVSFHAVSALGGLPGRNGEIRPMPRRVLDPLALVLWRLSAALR